MTTSTRIVDEAERFVRRLAVRLTTPEHGECLCCFVERQLALSPCDGTHRHALRFRDATAPRASRLLERLGRVGACCCDCELFANGYELRPDALPAIDMRPLGIDESFRPCGGVRRGSVQPCRNWARIRLPRQ